MTANLRKCSTVSLPLPLCSYRYRRFGSVELFKPWFPEVDPEDPRSRNWLRRLSDRDIALILIQLASTLVFLVNLGITTYAFVRSDGLQHQFVDILGSHNGGTCNTVRLYNRWLHFGINALSTVLLGASNYCAQLLVAPTRPEVNKAHACGRWLDIGIQSFRNLSRINTERQVLWVLLMFSSALLHLL